MEDAVTVIQMSENDSKKGLPLHLPGQLDETAPAGAAIPCTGDQSSITRRVLGQAALATSSVVGTGRKELARINQLPALKNRVDKAMSSIAKVSWIKELFSEHVSILCAQPVVGVLSSPDVELKEDEKLKVVLTASLEYNSGPAKLSLCRLEHSDLVPIVQVASLRLKVEEADRTAKEKAKQEREAKAAVTAPLENAAGSAAATSSVATPWSLCWPIHEPEVSRAVQSTLNSIYKTRQEGEKTSFSVMLAMRWLAYSLRLWRPRRCDDFLKVIHDTFGPRVAYTVGRNEYFVRCGWFLVPLVCLGMILDANPTRPFDERKRIIWEVMKVLLLVWGACVVWMGAKPDGFLLSIAKEQKDQHLFSEAKQENVDYDPEKTKAGPARVLQLCLAVFVIAVFLFFVFVFLYMAAELLIWVNFDWAGCEDPNKECKSASDTKGGYGMLAEIAVDILVAALFELFSSVGWSLASWIASLRNCKKLQDFEFTREMLMVLLAAFERIGTFGIFAIFFVPQWEDPTNVLTTCDDLVGEDASLYCMQRKLPVGLRRSLFAKMFKGPFVVAPFVSIIVKVVVPSVTYGLDKTVNSLTGLRKHATTPFRVVAHILALIFLYDGSTVGGPKYICKGLPFNDVKVETCTLPRTDLTPSMSASEWMMKNAKRVWSRGSTAEATEKDNATASDNMATQALQQGLLKRFEPMSELLELKLCFLWILFFGPIMPIGILPTLAARLVECNSDVFKMLFIRQRLFPAAYDLMHYSQSAFARAAVFAAVGWSVALTCTTYNDGVWKWEKWKQTGFLLGMMGWIALSSMLVFTRCGLPELDMGDDDDSQPEKENTDASATHASLGAACSTTENPPVQPEAHPEPVHSLPVEPAGLGKAAREGPDSPDCSPAKLDVPCSPVEMVGPSEAADARAESGCSSATEVAS
eukprot:TRINITY_DN10457_c0_g1_i1.p1 TRINITY_DN10457_c0_g1~~TRINITY_DN10457_c0_g1_i1.p1  ORF type:complete len:922 (+),score=182.68 TRINITY_DN10457_c0_g1_i1:84-2849(+)